MNIRNLLKGMRNDLKNRDLLSLIFLIAFCQVSNAQLRLEVTETFIRTVEDRDKEVMYSNPLLPYVPTVDVAGVLHNDSSEPVLVEIWNGGLQYSIHFYIHNHNHEIEVNPIDSISWYNTSLPREVVYLAGEEYICYYLPGHSHVVCDLIGFVVPLNDHSKILKTKWYLDVDRVGALRIGKKLGRKIERYYKDGYKVAARLEPGVADWPHLID